MVFLYLTVGLSSWAVLMLGWKGLKTVQINTFPVGLKQLGWDVSLKQIIWMYPKRYLRSALRSKLSLEAVERRYDLQEDDIADLL